MHHGCCSWAARARGRVDESRSQRMLCCVVQLAGERGIKARRGERARAETERIYKPRRAPRGRPETARVRTISRPSGVSLRSRQDPSNPHPSSLPPPLAFLSGRRFLRPTSPCTAQAPTPRRSLGLSPLSSRHRVYGSVLYYRRPPIRSRTPTDRVLSFTIVFVSCRAPPPTELCLQHAHGRERM